MESCKTKSSSDSLVGVSVVCPNQSFIIIEICHGSSEVKQLHQAHCGLFMVYVFHCKRTSSAKCIAGVNGAVI